MNPIASPPGPVAEVRHVGVQLSRRAGLTLRVLRLLFARPLADMADPQLLVRVRTRMAGFDRMVGALALPARRFFHWTRGTLGGVRIRDLRLRGAVDADGDTVLFYLHGGGFFFRMLNLHMHAAARIARAAGIGRCVMPIYRLAPEHPFPAGVDDCVAAYTGLLHTGVPAHRIVLGGDSAGGGLVLKLLFRLRQAGIDPPAGAVLLSPVTDLSISGPSFHANRPHDPVFGKVPPTRADFYLGTRAATDPDCSPLFGDFANLPPLLVQAGSTERLLDDSVRLQDAVQRVGGHIEVEVWEQMPHVWHLMGLPESRQAIQRLGEFLRQALSARRPGGVGT